MNDRFVKKALKRDWKRVAPDARVLNETRRAVFDAPEYKNVDVRAPEKPRRKKSALPIYGAAALVLIAVIVTSLVLWLPRQDDDNGNPVDPFTPVNAAYAEEYAFSAASSGIVLLKYAGTATVSELAFAERTLIGVTALESAQSYGNGYGPGGQWSDEELVDTLNGYMELVESVLSGSGHAVRSFKSDKAGYDVLLETEVSDAFGSSSAVRLYYSETLLEADGDEREYRLNGIMQLDSVVYEVRGKRSVEEADGEEEFEFEAEAADGTAVKVGLETEADEKEYVYTVCSPNGEVLDSFSLEAEYDDGETEVELIIGADKDTGVRFTQSDSGGSKQMHGVIVSGGVQRRFSVTVKRDPDTGRKQYEYSVGERIIASDDDEPFDD